MIMDVLECTYLFIKTATGSGANVNVASDQW